MLANIELDDTIGQRLAMLFGYILRVHGGGVEMDGEDGKDGDEGYAE